MDILGGLSILSSGVRMARNLISDNAKQSGKPFALAPKLSPGEHLMTQRDHNGDGKLSLDELAAPQKIFDRLDKNGDGMLTAQELNEGILAAQQAHQMERAIARYLELHDSDHDALISDAESGMDNNIFTALDKNNDGFLNRGELTSAYQRQKVDLSA